MKQRILKLIAVLLFVAGNATAQSLSVTDIDVYRKKESTIHVNISGAETITALQFNLSLPSGVTLAENEIHYGIAGYGCEMTTQPLENGDYLVVLYNMYQKTFRDGTLIIIPIVAGENGGTTTGSLYNVRMATTDAVSYKCENVSFNVTVTTPITGVTIDKETITLTEGETETLIATVSPAHAAYPTVTWTTSDASVATVDGGVLTAVKAGTATITATAGGYSANCVVTVEVATSIENVNSENSVVKAIYDLQGHKVVNPGKGIYIINGKKVLVK